MRNTVITTVCSIALLSGCDVPFSPETRTGTAARHRIEEVAFKLPSDSGSFYFFATGMTDKVIFISFDVSSEAAQTLISNYSGHPISLHSQPRNAAFHAKGPEDFGDSYKSDLYDVPNHFDVWSLFHQFPDGSHYLFRYDQIKARLYFELTIT